MTKEYKVGDTVRVVSRTGAARPLTVIAIRGASYICCGPYESIYRVSKDLKQVRHLTPQECDLSVLSEPTRMYLVPIKGVAKMSTLIFENETYAHAQAKDIGSYVTPVLIHHDYTIKLA